jgi:hypothetical protein
MPQVILAFGLAFAAAAIATAALAEPQTRFYDAQGRSLGTATAVGGGSINYRDAQGRSLGRSPTTPGGTTTYYDSRGRVTGRSSR